MAKSTTVKSNSKTKKADVKEEVPLDKAPVWMQDAILERIGEQAKDWDETPRAAQREELKAHPAAAIVEMPAARAPSTSAIPAWSGVAAFALVALFVLQLAWLSWRAVVLTRSLEDLNANVKELAAKVATWSDAETPAQR